MNKILFLVDNDRIVRMFYQERLSPHGLEVLTSSELEGLFEKVQTQKPDIILMDSKRWEKINAYPALEYGFSSIGPGYYLGKAVAAGNLSVKVEITWEEDVEFLDVILTKKKKRARTESLMPVGEIQGVPLHLPKTKPWQQPNWNIALNHH